MIATDDANGEWRLMAIIHHGTILPRGTASFRSDLQLESMRLLLVLPIALGCVVGLEAHGQFGMPWSLHQLWGIRGGDDASSSNNNHSRGVSLGLIDTTISPNTNDDNVMTCTAMHTDFGTEIFSSGKTLESDAVEALATTSDVIVVSMDNSSPHEDVTATIESIVRASKRRSEHGMAKLVVVVVLKKGASMKDELKVSLQSELAPSLLEVVGSNENFEVALRNIVNRLPSSRQGIDVPFYEALLSQVYRSLTSKESLIRLERVSAPESKPVEEQDLLVEETPASVSVITGDVSHNTAPDLKPVEELDLVAAETPADVPDMVVEDTSKDVPIATENVAHSSLLDQAMEELEGLEISQEELWLNDDDAQTPLLHFGATATSILNKSHNALSTDNTGGETLKSILSKLQQLYQDQLQVLREHYGRRYDRVLDETSNEGERTAMAERVTEGFRAAAQHAIPEPCREGQEYEDAADFGYATVLQGLISDMIEATSMRQEYDEALEAPDDDDVKKPTTWYKKVAAKALVLGINYLQGWLAWQGVKRAAVKRDKDMPKFPLF